MKALMPLLILTLAAASSLHAAESPQAGSTQAGSALARSPIRPVSDCLRIDQINEWHIVDDRTAVVRAGPKRFRVNLQSACPRLGIGPAGLLFRANPSNQAVGENRICGEVGETVRSPHQPPCAIQSAVPIDKAEFDRLAAHAKHSGSAADQPTARP